MRRTVGVRTRLFAGFGIVLVLLTVMGAVGWRNTVTRSVAFIGLYEGELAQTARLSRAQRALYEVRLGAAGQAYSLANPNERAAIVAADAQWLGVIDDEMRGVAAAADLSSDEQETLRTWDQTYAAFLGTRTQVIALVDAGQTDQAGVLRTREGNPRLTQASDSLQRLIDTQIQRGSQAQQDVLTAATQSAQQIVGISVAALVVTILVAHLLARHIARGVGEVARAARSLA